MEMSPLGHKDCVVLGNTTQALRPTFAQSQRLTGAQQHPDTPPSYQHSRVSDQPVVCSSAVEHLAQKKQKNKKHIFLPVSSCHSGILHIPFFPLLERPPHITPPTNRLAAAILVSQALLHAVKLQG